VAKFQHAIESEKAQEQGDDAADDQGRAEVEEQSCRNCQNARCISGGTCSKRRSPDRRVEIDKSYGQGEQAEELEGPLTSREGRRKREEAYEDQRGADNTGHMAVPAPRAWCVFLPHGSNSSYSASEESP
jgi:hypothetical protein